MYCMYIHFLKSLGHHSLIQVLTLNKFQYEILVTGSSWGLKESSATAKGVPCLPLSTNIHQSVSTGQISFLLNCLYYLRTFNMFPK